MQRLGQAAPAEDPRAEENRFEEEGGQAFKSKRGAEDIADEAGVVGPVHAELELLHDAGDDAHSEVNKEHGAEEPGGAVPVVLPCFVPCRLHNGDHGGKANGQWDEYVVVHGGNGKLPP